MSVGPRHGNATRTRNARPTRGARVGNPEAIDELSLQLALCHRERRRDEAVQLQNEAIASAERAGADPQLLADMRAQLARFRAGKRASAAFSPHSPMLEE